MARKSKKRVIGRPASGFFPVGFGLEYGHKQFLAANRFHLFADNIFDFFENPKTERQKSINAGHHFIYESGAKQKSGVDHFFIFRRLPLSFVKKLRLEHDYEILNNLYLFYR